MNNGRLQFFNLVKAMREAQREYFSTRSHDALQKAQAYPKELIEPCVLAGCPNGGVVLDPFMGTGTTAMVARMYGRNFIGFELNADYMSIINKKIQVTPNMFYL